jgi:arsenate reductase
MSDLTLWHNPRCSKSRQAKQLLDDSGALYEERRYLEEPPTADELTTLLDALGAEPWDITRMGEDMAKALDLKDLPHDRGAWIDVLVANPILIERPILVTNDGRATVGRPPEGLKDLLG